MILILWFKYPNIHHIPFSMMIPIRWLFFRWWLKCDIPLGGIFFCNYIYTWYIYIYISYISYISYIYNIDGHILSLSQYFEGLNHPVLLTCQDEWGLGPRMELLLGRGLEGLGRHVPCWKSPGFFGCHGDVFFFLNTTKVSKMKVSYFIKKWKSHEYEKEVS